MIDFLISNEAKIYAVSFTICALLYVFKSVIYDMIIELFCALVYGAVFVTVIFSGISRGF